MKNLKIKYLFAKIIALLPTNIIRCYLYRKLLKYKIYKTYIGRKTVIAVDDAEFVECSIGGRNKFVGPMRITIGKGSTIGSKNDFNCGGWTKTEQFKSANYERCLDIGKETLITKNHYFDVAGLFAIGDYSCIAGINSQFWTHGAGVKDRNVTIGEHCYIGSAVRFAPGSSVGDNCIVGLGSVVTKSMITANNAIVAGHPAKVIRENYDWKSSMDI